MKFNFKIIILFFILFCFSGYGQQDTTSFVYQRSYSRLKEKGLSDLEAKNYTKESDSLTTRLFSEDMKRFNDEFLANNPPLPPSSTSSCSDIPASEKAVLLAIYNNLNGAAWATGWDFSPNAAPVTSWNSTTQTGWRGITVVNCHVIAINTYDSPAAYFSCVDGIFPDITNLTQLQTLVINDGQTNPSNYSISGGNLASIGNLEYLQNLYLANVNFNGSLPSTFSLLTDTLQELKLLNCNLSNISQIQTLLSNCVNLETLWITKSYIDGVSFPLPNEFSNLTNLKDLMFTLSRLNDASVVSQLTGLTHINLGHNELTQIPNLSNHLNLKRLYLSSNYIEGAVPNYFENFYLEDFRITDNEFYGNLPHINATRELHFYLNRFRFNDFVDDFNSYNNVIYNWGFYYAPQAKTDNVATINATAGQPITLTMCQDGNHHLNDSYQWYRNGSAIAGAETREYTFTASQTTEGVYHCTSKHFNPPMTNTSPGNFKSLTLYRNEITVNVVEYVPCDDCTSFNLMIGEKYIISGWVKEANESGITNNNVYQYTNSSIEVSFVDVSGALINSAISLMPAGAIIDGWQQIKGEFTVPSNVDDMKIELVNNNTSLSSFFDDIRVHPFNGNLKSFVYDQASQRLMAELDENNYATFYEYDKEGGLVRVKKETERGVYTIQESRSSTQKKE